MKVAMIIHGYTPRIGGAERQLAAIAPVLQNHGAEVFVLTRRLAGTSSFEKIDGVSVYRLPAHGPKFFASLTFTFFALLRLMILRPNLIHAHELISPSTTALIAHYLLRCPLVITLHSSGPSGEIQRMHRKFLGDLRLSLFRREAAAFIVISNDIDSELEDIGIPFHRRVLITNAVDTQRFIKATPEKKQEIRQALCLSTQSFIGIFVARLVYQKQPDVLIHVWPEVQKLYPDAILLIVGSGPIENELKEEASPGVVFCGGQADVTPYLQAADLFILPSLYEGLPVALLEALACELPCIATQVGGIPDVINQGENGWLIPAEDFDSLKQGILKLIKDPPLREKLGKNGRLSVLKRYTLEIMAVRLIKLYLSVIQAGAER